MDAAACPAGLGARRAAESCSDYGVDVNAFGGAAVLHRQGFDGALLLTALQMQKPQKSNAAMPVSNGDVPAATAPLTAPPEKFKNPGFSCAKSSV